MTPTHLNKLAKFFLILGIISFLFISFMIPFTVGVSIVLLPVPLILFIISFLINFIASRKQELSESEAKTIAQLNNLFKAFLKIIGGLLIVCIVIILILLVIAIVSRLLGYS